MQRNICLESAMIGCRRQSLKLICAAKRSIKIGHDKPLSKSSNFNQQTTSLSRRPADRCFARVCTDHDPIIVEKIPTPGGTTFGERLVDHDSSLVARRRRLSVDLKDTVHSLFVRLLLRTQWSVVSSHFRYLLMYNAFRRTLHLR